MTITTYMSVLLEWVAQVFGVKPAGWTLTSWLATVHNVRTKILSLSGDISIPELNL